MPSEFHRHDVVPTRLNHIKPTFQILLPPGPAVKAAFQAHETVRTAQVHLRHRMAAVGNRFTFVFYSSKYIKRQNIFLWCLSRIHKLVLWALKMEKTYRSCDLWITLQREIQNGKFEPCQHWYELFQKKIMFQVVKITASASEQDSLFQNTSCHISRYWRSQLWKHRDVGICGWSWEALQMSFRFPPWGFWWVVWHDARQHAGLTEQLINVGLPSYYS